MEGFRETFDIPLAENDTESCSDDVDASVILVREYWLHMLEIPEAQQ